MPGYDAVNGSSLYYSLDIGPLHLTSISTESPIDTADIDAEQLVWLESDLQHANNNRIVTPWLIVTGHRPLYCTNSDKTQCVTFAAWLRTQAEAFFDDSQTDVVIAAHEHGYERTLPITGNSSAAVRHGYSNPGAPVYIVNGAAGNREGNELPTGDQPWSVAQSNEIGYSVFNIYNQSVLDWTFFAANGTAIDYWTLQK